MYFDRPKKSELKKICPIFEGLSIAEKGQKMRYFKTVKPIKMARSKEVGAWN